MATVLRVVLQPTDRKFDFPHTSFWMTVYRGYLAEVVVPTEPHASVEGVLGRLRDVALNSCMTVRLDDQSRGALTPEIREVITEGIARINDDLGPPLLDPELLSTGKRGMGCGEGGAMPAQSPPVSDILR